MRWLNYQHFFYFWNVARHGSVTAASSHLRLAQPTISAQLKNFEDIIGVKLFERAGRKLKLTEEGKIAFEYAEQIFSLGQELLDVLEGNSEAKLKNFKIGISDVVPKSLAFRLIEPVLNINTKAKIQCLEDKTERLLADLSIGEIDIVIADRPIPTNIRVKAFNHFIGESGISFLASNALAKKAKVKFPKSLMFVPLLLPTNEAALRISLDDWFDRQQIFPSHVISFQDRSMMKIAAREGKGVIPVPSVIEKEVRKEFHLELVGKTDQVKEQLYIISAEKRLKNSLVLKICAAGQQALFNK